MIVSITVVSYSLFEFITFRVNFCPAEFLSLGFFGAGLRKQPLSRAFWIPKFATFEFSQEKDCENKKKISQKDFQEKKNAFFWLWEKNVYSPTASAKKLNFCFA